MNSLQTLKSEFKLLLIVAAISAVLVVVGILLLQAGLRPSSPTPSSPTPSSPTPEQQSEEQSVTDNQQSEMSISDWQTYRSEEFGFEVKHPSAFTIVQDESYLGRGVTVSLIHGELPDEQRLLGFTVERAVAITEVQRTRQAETRRQVQDATTGDTIMAPGILPVEITKLETQELGDCVWHQFEPSEEFVYSVEGQWEWGSYCFYDDLTAFFRMRYPYEPSEDDWRTYNQILSTFRFVEE